jgi:cupin 2 domain-containing protein
MTQQGNLFEGLPDRPLTDEQYDPLLDHAGVRIERIVSTGQTAPETGWFDQADDEWVCLLQGRARLEVEGGDETDLVRGDWMFLPAHCRHRVTHTQADPPTVWLAVFMAAG